MDATEVGQRTGRRPGISGTRGNIIRAARRLFAENGYSEATMRAIARAANVDAALIHHFFSSKMGLFSAAVEDALHPADCLDVVVTDGESGLGARLVRGFLAMCEEPERQAPLFAIIRSALSQDGAAQMLGEYVSERILGQVVTAIDASHPQLRSALVGSQLVGLATVRYIMKLEPLASADPETIVAAVGPTVQQYLTGDLDLPT